MGNMSYCRFENTARDLRDCLQAIENGELDDLSSYERDGLEELLDLCEEMFNLKGEIEEVLENIRKLNEKKKIEQQESQILGQKPGNWSRNKGKKVYKRSERM